MSGTGFAATMVGDIQVMTLSDGVRRAPLLPSFITNASREDINAALVAAGLPPDEITTPFNPVLVTTPVNRALIDTGNGAAAAQVPGATIGLMMDNLAAAGVAKASIDTVIISHCHGDHVNGLLRPDGSPAFPHAKVLVPEPEWAFWMDDAAMAAAPEGRMTQLFAMNRRVFAAVAHQVSQYAWDSEVIPGLTAVGTPGHSAGHTSFIVHSGTERLFILSDVTNNAALFMPNPGWHPGVDQDPVQAEATRRKTLAMLAETGMRVQGFHFPFPGRGFIARDGAAYRMVPAG